MMKTPRLFSYQQMYKATHFLLSVVFRRYSSVENKYQLT